MALDLSRSQTPANRLNTESLLYSILYPLPFCGPVTLRASNAVVITHGYYSGIEIHSIRGLTSPLIARHLSRSSSKPKLWNHKLHILTVVKDDGLMLSSSA